MENKSLKTKAYDYIKEKIVNCEYEPGQFLEERQLVEELGSSRTPIREALTIIEKENFVKILPKKGVMVCQITLKNIVEIHQAREAIEPNAIISFGNNLSKETLFQFREIFEAQITSEYKDIMEIYKIDDDFHRFITSAYHNQYIERLMKEIYSHTRRIRIMAGKNQEYSKTIPLEHLQIIDYILEGNFNKSADILREHLVISQINAKKLFMN